MTAAIKSPNLSPSSVVVEVNLQGRDAIRIELILEGEDQVVDCRMKAVGCLPFLKAARAFCQGLRGPLQELAGPSGTDHPAIILREVLLRAQGRWELPYKEDELCHCRAVPTTVVDRAIVGGCHTLESIKRNTSASTSCGTCRPDIEGLLKYRGIA